MDSQATEPGAVRVAVVDRSPAYRRGLELAFSEAGYRVEQPPDMGRWAESPGIRALVATCRSPGDARRLALARARGSDAVAVALLGDESPVAYREVLETGVESAVARDASLDSIVQVVSAALDQRTVLPTYVARTLARGGQDGDSIEQQHADWLRALARGVTVEELAETVGYSERAMYRQLRQLYERLGARNRTEALLQALRRGLID
jgi:DNA-binding NarL/FixJ family response regulator